MIKKPIIAQHHNKGYSNQILNSYIKNAGSYIVLNITAASRRAGVSRAAIHKAIKSGRISWTKDDNNRYLIDQAELDRVYQPVDEKNHQHNTENHQPVTDSIDYKLIAQKLELTERLLWQTENERDRLIGIISLLGHNQGHQEQTEKKEGNLPQSQSRLWMKLFGNKKT